MEKDTQYYKGYAAGYKDAVEEMMGWIKTIIDQKNPYLYPQITWEKWGEPPYIPTCTTGTGTGDFVDWTKLWGETVNDYKS